MASRHFVGAGGDVGEACAAAVFVDGGEVDEAGTWRPSERRKKGRRRTCTINSRSLTRNGPSRVGDQAWTSVELVGEILSIIRVASRVETRYPLEHREQKPISNRERKGRKELTIRQPSSAIHPVRPAVGTTFDKFRRSSPHSPMTRQLGSSTPTKE